MIFPTKFPPDGDDAEREGFDAFRKLPGRDFDVFYHVSFSAGSSREKNEYEVDFIVADLRNNKFNGLACVEMKKGILRVGPADQWTQNSRVIKSPVEQVTDAMHSLVVRYPEISSKVPFGWMVFFPDGRMNDLPNSINELQLIDIDKMRWMFETLTSFFDNLMTIYPSKNGLGMDQYLPFRNQFSRQYEFVPPLSFRINSDEDILLRLTKQQSDIIKAAQENPMLLVKGMAGSGKTIIAKEIATDFSRMGLKVLLLCFNKTLANNIDAYFRNAKIGQPEVRIRTYHSYASETISKKDTSWWGDNFSQTPEFWNNDVPLKLAYTEYDDEMLYDVIIVDEGQDFSQLWYESLEYALKQNGRFYVFKDEFQNIFNINDDCLFYNGLHKMKLEHNCRSTLKIAEKLGNIISRNILSKEGMPEGVPVKIVEYTNNTQQQTLITAEITRLMNEDGIESGQMLLMMNTGKEESCLAETNTINNMPIVRLGDHGYLNNHQISYTQINTYKGLEADIVFIIDTDLTDKKKLYTQASRAKHLLYVFEKAT
jgi:hypothetical protein